MHRDTTKVWTSAMSVARSRAEGAMTAWSDMELQFGSYVPPRRIKGSLRLGGAARGCSDTCGAGRAGDELDGCGGRRKQSGDPR